MDDICERDVKRFYLGHICPIHGQIQGCYLDPSGHCNGAIRVPDLHIRYVGCCRNGERRDIVIRVGPDGCNRWCGTEELRLEERGHQRIHIEEQQRKGVHVRIRERRTGSCRNGREEDRRRRLVLRGDGYPRGDRLFLIHVAQEHGRCRLSLR